MGRPIKLHITNITENMVWQRVPERVQDSHKGTYGKLLCVAGSSRFRGAAALCTEGALRSGCGIVTLASTEPVFASVQSRMPEAVLMPCTRSDVPDEKGDLFGGIAASDAEKLKKELNSGYSALVIGPGMGNTDDTAAVVRTLTENINITAVLDADALNSLTRPDMRQSSSYDNTSGSSVSEHQTASHDIFRNPELRHDSPYSGHMPSSIFSSHRRAGLTLMPYTGADGRIIITPHPGELARLCGCSIDDIKASRAEIALLYAIKNNCIVVLKEHRTLIATPEGRIYRNTSGNSGLARGGSGDILAGMIGSFAAQGLSAEDSAICGVWLHGRAAERCSARRSQTCMLPHDIFEDLGIMMREHNR